MRSSFGRCPTSQNPDVATQFVQSGPELNIKRGGIMQASTVAIVVAFVGVGGVIIGQRMARESEEKKFRRDCRKEEFQTLLSALTKSYGTISQLRAPLVPLAEQEQRALSEAEAMALMVIRDRVYIAEDVQRLDILNRWIKALRDIDYKGLLESEFSKRYSEINADIVKAANKNMK